MHRNILSIFLFFLSFNTYSLEKEIGDGLDNGLISNDGMEPLKELEVKGLPKRDSRMDVDVKKTPIKLQVDGDAKFLYYRMNNRDFNGDVRDKSDWTQGIFRLGMGFEPSEKWRAATTLQYSRVLGAPGNGNQISGEARYDDDNFRAHEAYLGWSPNRWDFSLGRQSWNYSEGFVISSFDEEVGVSYDGGRIIYETDYSWLDQVDLFFAINADRNATVVSTQTPGITSSQEHDDRIFGLYFVNRSEDSFINEFDFYFLHSQYGHSTQTTERDINCRRDPHTSLFSCGTGQRNVIPNYFQTIGGRMFSISEKTFEARVEGGVQVGRTRVINSPGAPENRKGYLHAKAFHMNSGLFFNDLRIGGGWAYASGNEPVDDWNSDMRGWQPLYHRGNYTFGRNGVLAFTNSNDVYLEAQYDFMDNIKLEGSVHKVSFNNYRTGPVYSAEFRSEVPDNSIEYPLKSENGNTAISTDIGTVYDIGTTYYYSRRVNVKGSLMLHNSGKYYRHETWASLLYAQAGFRF